MIYLNEEGLKSFSSRAFNKQKPFPWANPDNLITETGLKKLRDNLPDFDLFTGRFGVARSHGQKSHDRYSLNYRDGLELPQEWRSFIEELKGEAYRGMVRSCFGVRDFNFHFAWFFTPAGCSVSPHYDSLKKFGVHIIYLNKDDEWDKSWGGETMILGSDKRIPRESAPEFEDFSQQYAGDTSGTHSLLFKRTRNSWHGVKEITCPEGKMRKIFLITYRYKSSLLKYFHALVR